MAHAADVILCKRKSWPFYEQLEVFPSCRIGAYIFSEFMLYLLQHQSSLALEYLLAAVTSIGIQIAYLSFTTEIS